MTHLHAFSWTFLLILKRKHCGWFLQKTPGRHTEDTFAAVGCFPTIPQPWSRHMLLYSSILVKPFLPVLWWTIIIAVESCVSHAGHRGPGVMDRLVHTEGLANPRHENRISKLMHCVFP
jgi:hypothetical protein